MQQETESQTQIKLRDNGTQPQGNCNGCDAKIYNDIEPFCRALKVLTKKYNYTNAW